MGFFLFMCMSVCDIVLEIQKLVEIDDGVVGLIKCLRQRVFIPISDVLNP